MALAIATCNTNVSAKEADPGVGRLSGKNISADFYDETAEDNILSNTLQQHGSRKLKSPYTKLKYTHKTSFDDRTILHGIDVSKWQGTIDWNKVKADGIDYAFIQVGFRGYGSSGILNETTKDPYFEQNMENAIAAGVRVGVYVFSQATTVQEAIEEAEYILDAIHGYDITMPLVLDYEYASTDSGLGGRLYRAKLSKKKATRICTAFCKEIAAAGYTPMVYANKSMLESQLNASELTDAGYRIWLANYTRNTAYTGIFDFWQYSERGSVDGISGFVDMNFYYVQETDNFAPAANSISSTTFSEVTDYIYTGDAILPEVTVSKNGVPLIPDVDYTITYSDNTEIGTATIEISGIGNYCDTRKIRFDILPQAMTPLKAKKRTASYITLAWSKDPSVTGYEIYRTSKFNGTYKKVCTITKNSTTSYKDTKLSAGKCYYYQIRSYKKIGNNLYYSDFSTTKNLYTQTGYTRNAITNAKVSIYDFIPGTKTETITVTEPTTEDSSSTDTPADTTTEDSSIDNTTTDDTTVEDTTESTTIGDTTTMNSTSEDATTEDTTTEDSTTEDSNTGTKTVTVDSTALVNVSPKSKMSVIYSTKYKKKIWYYVSYTKDGATYKGYVADDNITIARLGKIVKTKQVNVRKKATAYSKKLTTLKKNTTVDILSTKKKAGVTWYKVRFKKKNKTYNGWIASPYIKII